MEILKKLRLEKNLKQIDMANYLNVAKSTYNSWENNVNEPDIETLKKLADFFQCSIDYLLGREREDYKIILNGNITDKENNLLNIVRKLTLKNQNLLFAYSELLLDQQEKGNL